MSKWASAGGWRVRRSISHSLLPPATKLGQGNIFRSMCQEFCPQGGGGGGGGARCRGVVSQQSLQVSRPTPRGKLRGLAGGWGGSPGPHPGGKLRGLARGVLQVLN